MNRRRQYLDYKIISAIFSIMGDAVWFILQFIPFGDIGAYLQKMGYWYWVVFFVLPVFIYVVVRLLLEYSDTAKQLYLRYIVSNVIKIAFVPDTYKYLDSKYIYEYHTRWKIQHNFFITPKILSPEFKDISFRQKWTGKDTSVNPHKNNFEYVCKTLGYKIETSKTTSEYCYYKISAANSFASPKVNSSLGTLEFQSDCVEDTLQQSEPFYAKSIFEDTNSLTLELRFHEPIAKSVSNVSGEVYVRALDKKPFLVITEPMIVKKEEGNYVSYQWTIDKPIYGGRYLLTWVFN